MTETDHAPFSEAQVAEYFREGYLIARELVPSRRLDALMSAIGAIDVEPGGRWTPQVFHREEPTRDASYHQLLTEPNVVAAVEQLLGAPAMVLYGMVAVVPAKGGSGLAWHQDNQYSHVLGRALNVFVALRDIDDDMANLWIAPRSHVIGVQASRTDEGHRELTFEPDNGSPVGPLNAGDAVIFDRYTAHRSLKNLTDRHRYAYAAQYCERKARLADTGKPNPQWVPVDELRRTWETHGLSSAVASPA